LKNIIPVVLAADENYSMPMSVTMVSILANAKETTFIDFFLLVPSQFSKQFVEKINSLKDKYPNCNIHFIDMKDRFNNVRIDISHTTFTTYYRLLAANLLPQYDKCIYLDADTVVCGDLSDLFNTSISIYYIAGVKAPLFHYPKGGRNPHCKKIGLPSIDQYINAGILLMNLKKMRDDGIIEKFLLLIENNYPTQDQDVLNVACYNHIKHLHFKYNIMTKYKLSNVFLNGFDKRVTNIFRVNEIEEAINNPQIIHYVDKVKPWNDISCYMSKYWWNYARFSPFYSDILKQNIEIILQNYFFNNISNDEIVYILKDFNEIKKKLKIQNDQIKQLYNSYSFKLGNAITYLPRKMLMFFNCWEKHGLLYAIKRSAQELKRFFPIS